MNNKAKLLVLPIIIQIAALTVMIVSASSFILHQQQSIAQEQQQQQTLSNQTMFDVLKTHRSTKTEDLPPLPTTLTEPLQSLNYLIPITRHIEAITNNITSHNPDEVPNPDQMKQMLTGIAMQILSKGKDMHTGETSETMAIQAMSEIAAEVDVDPKGLLAQSLITLSQQTDYRAVIEQISRQRGNIVDSIINAATSYILEISKPADLRIIDEAIPSVTQTEIESILETVPSVAINSELNATLNVEVGSLSIDENTPTTVVVSGTLTYINGSGIKDEVISTSIASPGQNTYEYKRKADTDNKGIYEVDFNDVRLPKGTYEIMARPSSDNYSNLSASTQFVVESLPLSFNDIFPYLAASGIIIGIVSYVPRWFIRKRERNNLTHYMIKINEEYNKFSKYKEIEYLNHLSGLRMELIEILKEGKINETQYEMLDKKISDYIDRVNKDIYKFTK